MIRANIIIVTFLALGFAWWELSGGTEFVPGEHGVQIMADFKPYNAPGPAEAQTPKLRLQFPEAVLSAKNTPRVSSLQSRDPDGAKVISVRAPGAAVPDANPALFQTIDVTEPGATDPDPTATLNDQDLAALLADKIQNAPDGSTVVESLEPEQPQVRISGLGGSLPLGTPMNGIITPPTASQTSADMRVVSGTRVNLRGGPATSYDVVTQLLKGVEVEVLDDTGDGWVRLRTIDGNEVGWMSDDFLEAAAR
ncbi:SH3 domain-containing protein [Antarctobacter jejuensis]|uniref:SH3 domain-containing protein n=1 Tax=Antarctobacter jejuensis TaxID=1439938 RepID=UPI003FD26842